jgi:hypothetical protein
MSSAENFRQYAADCVRQAEGQPTVEDKNILLNMALAWVRLAQQTQEFVPPDAPAPESQAVDAASVHDQPLQPVEGSPLDDTALAPADPHRGAAPDERTLDDDREPAAEATAKMN